MDETRDHKRPPNAAVQDRRQVKDALADIARHEGHGLGHRIDSLRNTVIFMEKQLDAAVAKLPRHLREHSRVTDLRKALASLSAIAPSPDE
jgi:hypothetical protein